MVEKGVLQVVQAGGAGNEALAAQIKTQVMPKVIDKLLGDVVTAETVLRLHREGGDYKTTLAQIVAEKMASNLPGALANLPADNSTPTGQMLGTLGKLGKLAEGAGIDPGKVLGGLLGKTGPATTVAAESGAEQPAAAKSKFTLSNVKRFTLEGPFAFSLGVAKVPAAADPDVTADLAFKGGVWKLVGLRPKA